MHTLRATDTPLVDLVIAVHDPTRPLERALRSVLEPDGDAGGRVRVNVVCHNISEEEIRGTLPTDLVDAVRWWELNDGIRSPTGPFEFGMANSDARYVSMMGSDDQLDPGALVAWLQRAEKDRLIALIPPQRHASGRRVRTPPVRPGRRAVRDGVRDRLAYRTAPLGLIRRDAIDDLGLELIPGAPAGGDQVFSAKLWFSGKRIGYARNVPEYVVGADARQRVSTTTRPFALDLAVFDGFLSDPWFMCLAPRTQRSLVVKMVRTHLFGGVTTRIDNAILTADDRRHLAGFLELLQRVCPDYARVLSLADRRLIDALVQSAPVERVALLVRARRRFGYPTTVITRDVRGLFAVEGPLRFMIASALL